VKAIVQHRYGSPDLLELADVPCPEPAPGEVLVRVRAASIFAGDLHVIRGRPLVLRFATGLRRPRNPVPGIDLAGVVGGVGAGVTRFTPGDPVFGWAAGSLAECVAVPEDHLEPLPTGLTFEQAAAVPEAGMTALQALRDRGRVRPGQSVLVIGASGGVGTFAVQVAKVLGATVTAVCSTRNVEQARALGADQVVDYTAGDPFAGEARYDVIVQVAGTASPGRLRRLLTRDGTLVLSSGDGRLNGIDRIVRASLTFPFSSRRLGVFVTRENHADLATLRELLEAGSIRPVIDRTYPLAEAPAALRYLETGHARGKVVIAAAPAA
jgi:NADPH:quinone reductase-like Zn-dependent oxidoreductase